MRAAKTLLLSLLAVCVCARANSKAILLSKVKSLTLRDGQKTTNRRVAALPQLTCVGGNAKGLYNIDVMRCENSGSSYDTEDISWTCKASVPPEFKLGSTEVVCEGYDSPDDPFVLKGSCGVEYRLTLTTLGEEKYPERMKRGWKTSRGGRNESEGSDWLAATLFWLIFGGVVCVILCSIFFGTPDGQNNRANNNRRWGGWGGGGGDDDNNDPPPPYTPRAPPRGFGKSSSASSSRAQEQWRPGFWSGAATGAAAGAAAGYAAGNRNANAQARYPPAQAGPSSWFNSGQRSAGAGGRSFTSSASEPSSSRQESTGFGGTRRR